MKKQTTSTLRVEPLEDRRMLANLQMFEAFLVESGGQTRLSQPVVGQEVAIRTNFNTVDLPRNVPGYDIEFRVDGVPLRSGSSTLGAGQNGTNGYWWWVSGWYASAGTHTVEVILDADNAIAEDSESDNTFTFTFRTRPAGPPQKMAWPLPTAPLTESMLTNYADVDPRDGVVDFMGGNAAYDGHNAVDVGPGFFYRQDEGVPILAAMDGVVSEISDGEFDRHDVWTSGNQANYVVLDHGDGWETYYWHMRRDSVNVDVGQVVSKGDLLGLVGSSGFSDGPHLHFEVKLDGLDIETFYDPTAYWESPPEYVGDEQYLIESWVTNYNPTDHFWSRPSVADEFKFESSAYIYAGGLFSGLRRGEPLNFRWYRPDGSLYTSTSFSPTRDFAGSGWWQRMSIPDATGEPEMRFGEWRVDFLADNVVIGSDFFLLTPNGKPEARLENQNGDIIGDGQYTPQDFGVSAATAVPATTTFLLTNHGGQDLQIGGIELPVGYTLEEGLPAILAPGESNDFRVALSATDPGYYAGQISISTNDENESDYNFAVEGVRNDVQIETLTLGISRLEMEAGDRIVANLRRTGSTSRSAVVQLTSSDASAVTVPESVTFGARDDYVQFFIEANADLSGAQMVSIIADSSGYSNATNTVFASNAENGIPGDFNSDGELNEQDIDALMTDIVNGSAVSAFDMNGDGAVDLADRDDWLDSASRAQGYVNPFDLGDLNLDGTVDSQDLGLLLNNFGSSDSLYTGGESNGDSVVDSRDLGLLLNNFGKSLALARVELALEVVDAAGDSIEHVAIGQAFTLNIYTQDLTNRTQAGVFKTYLDVFYDTNLVMLNGDIAFGESYLNERFGDVLSNPGTIDDVGGTDGLTDLGNGRILLASVPLTALATGRAEFIGSVDNVEQGRETALFGDNDIVDTLEIRIADDFVTITE